MPKTTTPSAADELRLILAHIADECEREGDHWRSHHFRKWTQFPNPVLLWIAQAAMPIVEALPHGEAMALMADEEEFFRRTGGRPEPLSPEDREQFKRAYGELADSPG